MIIGSKGIFHAREERVINGEDNHLEGMQESKKKERCGCNKYYQRRLFRLVDSDKINRNGLNTAVLVSKS